MRWVFVTSNGIVNTEDSSVWSEPLPDTNRNDNEVDIFESCVINLNGRTVEVFRDKWTSINHVNTRKEDEKEFRKKERPHSGGDYGNSNNPP